jgi:hypothetical protein
VFDAVVDPKKMTNYFISSASGPLKPGKVEWEFGDVGAKVSIEVPEVEDNRKIVFDSSALGPRIRTTIQFAPDGPGATVVTVTDSKFPLTEGGLKLRQGVREIRRPGDVRRRRFRCFRENQISAAWKPVLRICRVATPLDRLRRDTLLVTNPQGETRLHA